MSPPQSLLYRIGYALERARRKPARAKARLEGLRERRRDDAAPSDDRWPDTEELLTSGVVAATSAVLDAWRPRGSAGPVRLVRAAVAGAAAALLVDLVRPLLSGRPELPQIDRGTVDRALAGAGQGLLYGAQVEPRVPGPPALKGAVYGSVEYVADPLGGLARLLGPHSPHRRLPVVGDLLDDLSPHDRAFLEHVIFGIALAALYGAGRSSNGIRVIDEGE